MDESETKQRILDTATDLFGRHGMDGVSTGDIAKSAGVNKALVFYYYGSKDRLYRAVFRKLVDSMVQSIRDVTSAADPGLPRIEAFIRSHITRLRENPDFAGIVIRELLYTGEDEVPGLHGEMAATLSLLKEELLEALFDARRAKQIRNVDLLHTIISIISLDIFFFLGKPVVRMVNPDMDVDEFEKERIDHVLDLLMNGLKKGR